jgi:hypothetical protein
MRSGHRVSSHGGPERVPDADLGFLHVDLSVVPPPYLAALAKFPKSVNGGTADIRKRGYSTLLLRQGEPWSGPVIVKTDLNSSGMVERLKAARAEGRPVKIERPEYPVYESVHDVPPGVWNDPALIVERFITDIHDGHYCICCYWFLGDAEVNLRLYSSERVVKGATTLRVEHVPVPENLRALRRRMAFDYGKFDYVMQGSEAVLFDANRTPATLLMDKFGLLDESVSKLATGLDSLLAG